MRMALVYVDKWVLREDGCIEASFRDSTGMKIVSSAIVGIDELNLVRTNSGMHYAIGEPLYDENWPGSIPAKAVNDAFFYAIRQFVNNIRGDTLWEIFQDELAILFVGSR